MYTLYERIELLCELNKITLSDLCRELDVSRAAFTELKMGRTKSLSTALLSKISEKFNIDVKYFINENYGFPIKKKKFKKIMYLIPTNKMELFIEEILNLHNEGDRVYFSLDELLDFVKKYNIDINIMIKLYNDEDVIENIMEDSFTLANDIKIESNLNVICNILNSLNEGRKKEIFELIINKITTPELMEFTLNYENKDELYGFIKYYKNNSENQ